VGMKRKVPQVWEAVSLWLKNSNGVHSEKRRTEDREQKTENRRQRTEDREQKTENRRQRTEDRERKTVLRMREKENAQIARRASLVFDYSLFVFGPVCTTTTCRLGAA
jgi:uncharacterized membrane protein YdbT with pleckstrin-like domain